MWHVLISSRLQPLAADSAFQSLLLLALEKAAVVLPHMRGNAWQVVFRVNRIPGLEEQLPSWTLQNQKPPEQSSSLTVMWLNIQYKASFVVSIPSTLQFTDLTIQ